MGSVTATCNSSSDDSAVGSVAWSNVANAQGASFADYATAAMPASGATTHYMVQGFEFTGGNAVPSGVTIVGIELALYYGGNSSQIKWNEVRLRKAGTAVGNDNSSGAALPLNTPFNPVAFGSSSDLWGTTWADTDFGSGAGFAVQVQLIHTGIDTTQDARAFGASATVTYADPATGTGSATFTTPSLAGTGAVGATGSGGVTFPKLALSGSGAAAGSGITIIGPALAGSGTVGITGTGGVTIPRLHLSGTGLVTVSPVFGTGGVTIARPALAGRGAVGVTGTGGITIAPPSFAPPSPVEPRPGPPLVTLTYLESITRALPVQSCTWQAPEARQKGTATVFVPVGSDARNKLYINEEGRFLVQIRERTLGLWRGYATGYSERPDGITIEAEDISGLFDRAAVGVGREFRSMTAGVIVRAALAQALGGLGLVAIVPGTFVEAAPIVVYQKFSGESFSQILGELMDHSGQEWELDEEWRFSWVTRSGGYLPNWLCHDADIVAVERRASFQNQVTEVTVRTSDGQSYTARV